jgi:hypothetical protein
MDVAVVDAVTPFLVLVLASTSRLLAMARHVARRATVSVFVFFIVVLRGDFVEIHVLTSIPQVDQPDVIPVILECCQQLFFMTSE